MVSENSGAVYNPGKRPGLLDVLFHNEPIEKIVSIRRASACAPPVRKVNAREALVKNALAFEKYQREQARASRPVNFHPQWTRTSSERSVSV